MSKLLMGALRDQRALKKLGVHGLACRDRRYGGDDIITNVILFRYYGGFANGPKDLRHYWVNVNV